MRRNRFPPLALCAAISAAAIAGLAASHLPAPGIVNFAASAVTGETLNVAPTRGDDAPSPHMALIPTTRAAHDPSQQDPGA